MCARRQPRHTAAEVAAAYDRLAAAITAEYAARNPLLLCVMIGGLVPTAEIIRRLAFQKGGNGGPAVAWSFRLQS